MDKAVPIRDFRQLVALVYCVPAVPFQRRGSHPEELFQTDVPPEIDVVPTEILRMWAHIRHARG